MPLTGSTERELMSAADMGRALSRIAHEVVERNRGTAGLALVGIHRRGVPLAARLGARIAATETEGEPPLVGSVDITLYRDDAPTGLEHPVLGPTEIPFDVTGKTVVLVDDVLYTGRTVRAAIDALMDLGRPRAVQLAVMVDRGHRELPIHADFVGRVLDTDAAESVRVRLDEVDGEERVVVRRRRDEP